MRFKFISSLFIFLIFLTNLSITYAEKKIPSLADEKRDKLQIKSPANNAIFPIDFAPPIFRWTDQSSESEWKITVSFSNDENTINTHCITNYWQPDFSLWESIKRQSMEKPTKLTVSSIDTGDKRKTRQSSISFMISGDPVDAPIFYRNVPLPFRSALMNLKDIEWKLGYVSSEEPPKTVLKNMISCANCHSFPLDGSVLAMDLDYGNDKGSYIICPVKKDVHLNRDEIISWSDYKKEDKEPTYGLLSQISPDGRYIISTVKDRSIQLPTSGIEYSQLFFPIRGILVVYDRKTGKFESLPGADNPEFVQTNPAWSPDGKWIVFARANADEYKDIERKYLEEHKKFRYDLYRIPFNNGNGGTAIALEGASFNGKSNYFPKYSPDGKWIVFCQSESFMLLQQDSLLNIMPAEGGTPRLMNCNHKGNMNSWHSFSPNSRWLVFSSKVSGPYTQLWLTHVSSDGEDSSPILLENFISKDYAANIPEFVNIEKGNFQVIKQHIFQ